MQKKQSKQIQVGTVNFKQARHAQENYHRTLLKNTNL